MDRKRLLRNPLIWILAAILVYFTFSVLFDDTRGYTRVDTSVALAQISEGHVTDALIEDREQRLRLTLDRPIDGSTQIITQYPAQTAGTIVEALENASNNPSFNTTVRQDSFLTTMLIYLIPLGLVLLILFWMMNNAQGGGNRVMSFGKSKAKQLNKDMPKTTFGDVAGADEAVEELHEIKDFLQNPARYQALGAKIPRACCSTARPAPARRCWPARSRARRACRSTRSPAPTSSRCSSASAPRGCATCSSRPSRTRPASSSSTRSTRSAASAVRVSAAATTSASRR